jgi:hypothetical protein
VRKQQRKQRKCLQLDGQRQTVSMALSIDEKDKEAWGK